MRYQGAVNDAASVARQQQLLVWLERQAANLSIMAGGALVHGASGQAWAHSAESVRLRQLARQVRERLVDASERALAELDDERRTP